MPAPAAAAKGPPSPGPPGDDDPFLALTTSTTATTTASPADLEAPPHLPAPAPQAPTPRALDRAPSTPGGTSLGRRSFHPHTGKLLMAQEPLVRVPALEDEHADLPVRAFLSPPEIFAHIATAGVDKKRAGPVREGVLGLAAGAYIGLGFSLCMNVGGQLSPALRHAQPGLYSLVFSSFGFPFGLTLCVIAGSSLFTSNVGYLTAAVWERRCSVLSAVRVCIYSYFCNALGALALAQLYIWAQVFAGEKAAFVIELAAKKTSNPWSVAFVRGILCNYLVVLAIWQANAAQDVASKAIAIFLPISAFVALGFEHCIANLFGLPLAMFLQNGPGGAEAVASVAAHSFPVPGKVPPTLTAARIVSRNLVPVTLGNIVGGSLFVATAYAFAFGAPGRAADDWVERQWLRFKLAVRRRARQAKVGHQGGGGGGGSGANGSSGRGLLDLHHGSGQQRATNRKAPAAAPAAANGTASAAAAAVLPPVGLTPAANGAIIPPLRTVRISSDGGEP